MWFLEWSWKINSEREKYLWHYNCFYVESCWLISDLYLHLICPVSTRLRINCIPMTTHTSISKQQITKQQKMICCCQWDVKYNYDFLGAASLFFMQNVPKRKKITVKWAKMIQRNRLVWHRTSHLTLNSGKCSTN